MKIIFQGEEYESESKYIKYLEAKLNLSEKRLDVAESMILDESSSIHYQYEDRLKLEGVV